MQPIFSSFDKFQHARAPLPLPITLKTSTNSRKVHQMRRCTCEPIENKQNINIIDLCIRSAHRFRATDRKQQHVWLCDDGTTHTGNLSSPFALRSSPSLTLNNEKWSAVEKRARNGHCSAGREHKSRSYDVYINAGSCTFSRRFDAASVSIN